MFARSRRLLGLAAIGSATMLAACNALLGNEERDLLAVDLLGTQPAPGNPSAPDASPPPDGARVCNAELSSDPRNCGICGHDCLEGACANGSCEPFLLASGQNGPSNLVTENGSLFWTNVDGTVHGCTATSCGATSKTLTTLDAGNPLLTGLAVRDGQLYFASYYTDAVYSCPVTGCAAPQAIATKIPQASSVVTDANNAYFLSASQAYLARCALPSCAGGPVKIAGDGLGAYAGAVLDDTSVYWFGGGPTGQFDRAKVYRAAKTLVDGGPEVLLDDRSVRPGVSPHNLAVRNGVLYVAEQSPLVDGGATSNGTVFQMLLGPGRAKFTLAASQPPMGGIAVDETHVYWVDLSVGAIKRCASAGCNLMPTTLVTAQNVPTRPVLTDTAIYWTEYLGGTLRGLAK